MPRKQHHFEKRPFSGTCEAVDNVANNFLFFRLSKCFSIALFYPQNRF